MGWSASRMRYCRNGTIQQYSVVGDNVLVGLLLLLLLPLPVRRFKSQVKSYLLDLTMSMLVAVLSSRFLPSFSCFPRPLRCFFLQRALERFRSDSLYLCIIRVEILRHGKKERRALVKNQKPKEQVGCVPSIRVSVVKLCLKWYIYIYIL